MEDPEVEKRQAAVAVANYVSLRDVVMGQKARIIVDQGAVRMTCVPPALLGAFPAPSTVVNCADGVHDG